MPDPTGSPFGQRVGEAMVWNSLAAPIKAALTLATSIIVARMLGPQDYGVYAILLSILATLGQYTDLGINRSLPRFIPQAEVRFGRAGVEALIRDTLVVKAALAFLVVVALNAAPGAFASWAGLGDGDPLWIRIVSVIFLLEVLREIALRILNSYFQQKTTNAVELATLAVHPAAVVLALGLGGAVTGALLAIAAVSVLGAFLLWRSAHRIIRQTPRRSGMTSPHEVSRSMVSHAATNYFLILTKYFAELSFVVFLLAWAGTDKAVIACFAIAYKIVGMSMNLLAIPLQSIQTPLMARLDAVNRPGGFARTYTVLLKYLVFALGPGTCLMVMAAPELLGLLYGDSYRDAAALVRILAPLCALETLLSLASNVLMIKGDYREIVWLRWASLAVAPLLAAAARWADPQVVVLVLGAARAFIAFIGYRLAGRRYQLPFPLQFSLRVLAAGIPMAILAGAALFVGPSGFLSLAGATFAGTLGFFSAFHFLGGFDAEEKQLLLHIPIPGLERLLRWI